MESQLVSEFVKNTGANPNDALSCLKSWGWDLKKAMIDYNDTSTTEYFNGARSPEELSPVETPFIDQRSLAPKPTQSNRTSLVKTNAIDVSDFKKLSRGISRATDNVNLVSRARLEMAMDFHAPQPIENLQHIDTPDYTFTLPDLSVYTEDFRRFLEKDLIESSTLVSLEQAQRLNWWVESGTCRKLWPLSTTGDGNCLLHAASLAMWGFHDRKLTLRSALFGTLSHGECRAALWRRWRFQQTRLNRQAGLVYSEAEWAREWEEIVAMASPEPRKQSKGASRRRSVVLDRCTTSEASIDDSATYESLEEIHVLALAHVLRRTIVVMADTVLRDMNGEAMAPIPFGGVYMPFEMRPADCHRGPLLLTYDMAHFSALVAMETSITGDHPPALVPLTDAENVLHPIQFCIDPGADFEWTRYDGAEGNWTLTEREHVALLKEYLDVVFASNPTSPDEELYSDDLEDEEFEKRFAESEIVLSEGIEQVPVPAADSRSKAAKQLQSVAKQFGSIGKSMSKKIKKNIGSITKIGAPKNGTGVMPITAPQSGPPLPKKGSISSSTSLHSMTRARILCAQLRAKRHEYQAEMIKNYLDCAHERFIEAEKVRERKNFEGLNLREDRQKSASPPAPVVALRPETPPIAVHCINAGCTNFGTNATSYMCRECFEQQRQRESSAYLEQPPRYGTGNSKFYTQTDMASHNMINRLPSVRRLNELDQTLYLSNSTFFNDKRPATQTPSNGNGVGVRSSLNSICSPSPVAMRHAATASVYSPGNTISGRHHIIPIQQTDTYHFPPTGIRTSVPEQAIDDVDSGVGVPTPFLQLQAQPCRTRGCVFYGSANSNFYCSKCSHNNQQQSKILSDV